MKRELLKNKGKLVMGLVYLIGSFTFYPSLSPVLRSERSSCLRRVRLDTSLTNPIQYLSLQEANEVCIRNMAIIRDNMPAFSEAARQALAIYQNEGLDAFEEKGMALLRDAIAPISQAVDTIKNLPRYIAFTQGSEVRQLTEDFLRGIASELGADKIVIEFCERSAFALNQTYFLGLSEKEYEGYLRNRGEIFGYLQIKDAPPVEERHISYGEKTEARWLENGPRLLQESGIGSAVAYSGFLTEETDEQGRWLNGKNWVQTIFVGRTEEGVKEKGAYTKEDIQRIEQAIRDRLDTYRQIKQTLFDQWHDFLTPQVYLRHNGGVDTFGMWQAEMVARWLPQVISEIRQQDENSAEAQEHLVRMLENIPGANENVSTTLASFNDMLNSGTNYQLQNVTPFLQERIASFQPLAQIKGLEFKTDITPEDLMINCNTNQLALVVDNVISNAIKYTQEGSVTVTAAKKYDNINEGMIWSNVDNCEYLEIVIEDTGIGIPKDEINEVYTRGYRASNVGDIQGTGIGLDIVNPIVRNMNGEMRIESEEGKGTKVIIRIRTGKESYE